MKKLYVVVIIIAFITCSIAARAAAQDTTGTISGRIVDAQGLAVPGVTVTATGSQGAKTAVTDSEGRFTVPFLTPGPYAVHAELQGFNPIDRADVQVRLGQTVEMPLTMQVGTLTEAIEVAAALTDGRHDQHDDRRESRQRHAVAPAGRSSLQRHALSRAGRQHRRQRRRRESVDRRIERPREPVRRGRREHHQRRLRRARVVLDRVRLARQRHAVRLHAGSAGEDRRLRGGVRTGDRRRDQRRHQERLERAQGQRLRLLTSRGPRIRLQDRAERRGNGEHRRVAAERRRAPRWAVQSCATACSSSAPSIRSGRRARSWRRRDFRSQALGSVDRDRRITNYAAKGTWQLTGAHRLDASFFGDPATGDVGPAAKLVAAEPDDGRLQRAGVRRPQPERPLRRRAELALSRGRVVRPRAQSHPGDAVRRRLAGQRLSGHAARPHGWSGVLRGRQPQRQLAVPGEGHEHRRGYGQHQIRYGFDYENLDFSQLQQYSGPTFTAPNGQQTATGAVVDIVPDPVYGQIYHVSRASLTAARPTTQHYGALFVEDEWKIGNSLTIRPGVRYEQETLSGIDRPGLLAQEQLGAAYRRRLGSEPQRQGEGVRELRPLLRPRAERSRRTRTVVRRVDHRRLLRCEPDAAGAGRCPDDQRH